MSDQLMRQFQVQMTTAMDSVFRTAVFEAIKIFENVLYGYQMELAQKGEEAAQLKLKLQRAELQLKELIGHGSEDRRKTERNEPQNETVAVVDVRTQTSEVPEIDFEVPDDWCAPLGTEVVIKQEDAVCPRVANNDFNLKRNSSRRSKRRRISLSRAEQLLKAIADGSEIEDLSDGEDDDPAVAEIVPCEETGEQPDDSESDSDYQPDAAHSEDTDSDMSEPQHKQPHLENDVSNLNKKSKHFQDRQLPVFGQGNQHPRVRNGVKVLLHGGQYPHNISDVKILLRDLKQEYPDLIGLERHGRRKGRNNRAGKEHDSAAKVLKEERKSTETNGSSAEPEIMENLHKEKYFCKYCHREFERKLSRDMHTLYHNRCRGCKRRFHLKADLKHHKESCRKHHKLLAKERAKSRSNAPLLKKKKVTPTTMGACASVNNRDGPPIKLSSAHHNVDLSKLRKRTGTYETVEPYYCIMCPKKYRSRGALKFHIGKIHTNPTNTADKNGDLGWTEPLEDIEDNQKDVTSPTKPSLKNRSEIP